MIEDVEKHLGIYDKYGLRTMVQFQPELLKERCKLQREYFEGREKLRIPKGKEYTDFDRNTMLEASVAGLREKYEYVKGVEELVAQRVELYKLMMEI